MADLGSGSQGQQSEGFEDIMARFFQPGGPEEEPDAGEEASLLATIQEVAERPGDTELHTRLADQFQELREGVAEALGEEGLAVVDSLVLLFRQMANFDIRLHRVMYQELEEAAGALEAILQGGNPDSDLADLDQRLRRHLHQEPGAEDVVSEGGEAVEEPGEEMEQAILRGLQELQQGPGDEQVMERVGGQLDEISEELTGAQETLALRMGDVLSSYAEGELAWSDTIGDALVRAGRVLVDQQDPQPAVEELDSLLQGGAAGEEPTQEVPSAGGEGGVSDALESLVQSPGDSDRLQKAVTAAESLVAEAEAGPAQELAQQLKALFEALASFDIRLHKVMVEDLRAAIGAIEADEQSQKDAAERLGRYVPGAAGPAGGETEPEPAAEEAEMAQDNEPEPEPEPEPEAEAPEESSEGEGGQEEAGPRADRARPEDIEIPDGLDNLPEDSDPDLVTAFVEESREGLEDLDQTFMDLEENPEDENLLHGAFRTIHTIKGTAGFIGLSRLQTLAHTMESVMDRVRNFEIKLNASIMDDLLSGTDQIRQVVENVAGGGGDNVDVENLIRRLAHYLDPNYQGEAPSTPKGGGEEAAEKESAGESGGQAAAESQSSAQPAQAQQAQQEQQGGGGDQEGGGSREAQSLRVPLDRIDRLFNLAGELVLTRNQTRELAKKVADKLDDDRLAEDLAEEAHRLDLVTSDLQSAVMQTRMHSMATSFNKFKRVVRDLARKTNKQIQLHISGEQTELDRNVIESIQDPLVHLIRNSVDHGIEEPEDREAKGKPRSGRLDLRAYYEENFVVIEVADDGAGLDSDKLRNKAISRGMIDESEAQQMSDREAQQLIFMAGFSSADQVSDISGRGVGMDVVRNNVEELKGSIQVDSAVDEGTTIKIRLPLTLSIQQTLIVQIGPEHFAIPLETVKETLDYDSSKVTSVRGQRVYQRANEILPILQMTELFGMSRVHDANARYLVVLELGMQRAGILVDRIVGKEEAVMKSLEALKGIYEPDYFAGASVRGDGRISLVVDVGRLFANVATMRGHARAREAAGQEEVQVETHPYLVLDGGGNEMFALARENVHDIELVNVRDIQWMNGHEYINREQRAMPTVRLSTITGETFRHPGEEAYVVYTDDGRGRRSMGILVNHLHGIQQLYHDETAETVEVEGAWDTALWEGRVVAILDVQRIQDATKHKVPDDLAAGA